MKPNWKRHYSAYLFDLDGTLVDTAPDIDAALNFSLKQAGLKTVTEDLTRHWVGHGSRTLIKEALDHQDAQREIEPLLKDFIHYYENNIANHSKPYPQVESTLAALKDRGAKLAVVTNKLMSLTTLLIRELNLEQYFTSVVCGDSTKFPKPSPEPVFLAMRNLDSSAAESLFVGDSETDVSAARNANISVVCMRDGYNHGIDVSSLDCDGVIVSMSELL